MKQHLEDMRLGVSERKSFREANGLVKRVVPASNGSLDEFDQWKSKKNDGEGNRQRELKKPANKVTNLESELEKAIKAASS